MIRIVILTLLVLLSFVQGSFAQQTVETKSREIAKKMDSITAKERFLLKKEIRKLEKDYDMDLITEEELESLKKDAVSKHAKVIQSEIEKLEKELHLVIQDRVNYQLTSENCCDDSKKVTLTIGDDGVKIRGNNRFNEKELTHRTYSNTVIAFGFHNLIKDGDINSISDLPYDFGKSRFFEIGLNYKTRIFKENSVFYLDYGISGRYNNLRVQDNLYFVSSGNTTNLAVFPHDLKKSRFKTVQLVVPLYLEMDFSKPKIKDGVTYYRRNRAFRFGIGGFGGINVKSKQILKYKLDGKNVRDKRKGDYNVNNFVYGLNAFIGRKDTSFYVKYDLNDLFHNNFEGQQNFSFGVRFDL